MNVVTPESAPAVRDLRSELVSAAVAMLAQSAALPSLRSIARACGVAPSAVYWHFASEAALRTAVLDAEYADLAQAVDQALAQPRKGSSKVVLAWQAYVAWGIANPGAYQALFESADHLTSMRADDDPRPQDRLVEMAATFDPATPLTSARLMWSAVHGLVSLRIHKTTVDWKISAADATARIVTALSAQQPTPNGQ
jgi:AcrR family transcriptional regulator